MLPPKQRNFLSQMSRKLRSPIPLQCHPRTAPFYQSGPRRNGRRNTYPKRSFQSPGAGTGQNRSFEIVSNRIRVDLIEGVT